jgi:hypothetical protein
MKKMSFLLTVIAAVFTLTLPGCFAQRDFLKLESHGAFAAYNPTPPSDGSFVLLDLPLGKYCFDTSVYLDEMNGNKVSPEENDNSLEQKALTLQFSLKW